MNYLKLMIAFLFVAVNLQAQEAIVATGNDATGGSGSVSYSIGQTAYSFQEGASGTVIQGVQQPYEISVVLSSNDNFGINLTMAAYPNPTIDLLNLKINNYSGETLEYLLFDIRGRVISQNQITSESTQINMVNLPTATYLLKVSSNNRSVKEFRIIKK